jgi:hypothetical protein
MESVRVSRRQMVLCHHPAALYALLVLCYHYATAMRAVLSGGNYSVFLGICQVWPGPYTMTQDVRVTASFELAQFEVCLPLVVRW